MEDPFTNLLCLPTEELANNCSSSSYLSRTQSGTSKSCGIVAGAAALVLEKFPHFTPQEVKEYLINQSTLGIVQTNLNRNEGRFLYVGEEDECD